MFPSLRASPLGLPVARGLCPLLRFAQGSLEAPSAVRVFPAYAGRPKSFTGFPRAVLWTGTVLLTIAHNLFATCFHQLPPSLRVMSWPLPGPFITPRWLSLRTCSHREQAPMVPTAPPRWMRPPRAEPTFQRSWNNCEGTPPRA
jgi:hypothetical protein